MGGQVNGSDLRQPRDPRLYRYPRASYAFGFPGVNACLHWGHRTCSKSTRRSSAGAIACPQWGQGVESEAFTFSRLSFRRLGIGGFYRMGMVRTVSWLKLLPRATIVFQFRVVAGTPYSLSI